MNVPLAGPSHSLTTLASWVGRVASAVAAGWNVEHRADGRHHFPWVRPAQSSIAFSRWTITAFTLLKYQVIDKTMTVQFDLSGTATAVTLLSFTIPGGYLAVESTAAGMFAFDDGGTAGTGDAIATSNRIDLYKTILAPAWTAGAVRVQGTLMFEVQ